MSLQAPLHTCLRGMHFGGPNALNFSALSNNLDFVSDAGRLAAQKAQTCGATLLAQIVEGARVALVHRQNGVPPGGCSSTPPLTQPTPQPLTQPWSRSLGSCSQLMQPAHAATTRNPERWLRERCVSPFHITIYTQCTAHNI